MIHITDFNGDIIDFISKSDGAVTEAEHIINVEDKLETFDFTVLTSRTENMQKRNRVIIEDKDGQYREFIIYNISSDLNGYTRVQTNASALEDIKTAKPVGPHKLNKHTVKQALEYALADTGWKVSDEAEWGGTRTTSWTGWHDRISILKQLETTYDMRLSFYVEVGSNKITNRYVSLNKVEPMFNGEEIVYGDNMIDLKRTVDFSDIATALICLGPENSETGKREIVEVKDDDAQTQFGLPYRYIWDIYEPQSSDEKMTRQRLTTLGRTALNKRKQESISYEIDGIGLTASAGDMIRVKNEDFTPELYVDAEVVEVTTDLISGESKYKFGVIKEYTRDDVYARFNAMLSGLRERLNKVVENTDSIISERLEEELKYVERYIEKSPTPPLKPKEGQLWLDTSHDGVAVLKRYENGEWIKSSVDNVKEIGGMTREETMYEALKERLVRNEVDYSEVFKRHGALVSEKHYHYVDEDIKNDLSSRYNSLQQSYDNFKIAFNNINTEQPTIGLITTAISRAVEFEANLKEYNDSYYVARKSFDEVIGVLQSQYSEEKFNEAMEEVASAIGGTFDGTNIIADIPNQEELKQLNEDIKAYLNGEIDSLDDKLGKQIETVVNQAKDQFTVDVNAIDRKVNGLNGSLSNIRQEVSKTNSNLSVLEDRINLKADSNTVKQILENELNAVKSNVQTNQAELKLLSNQLSSKVEKSEYTTDINGITRDISNTKTELNQLSDSVNSKFTSVEQKFDDLNIEGRNLVLKSDVPYNNSDYLIADYTLSKPMEVGKTYTITVKGSVENTGGGLAILRDNGRYFIGENVDKISDDLYRLTFKAYKDTYITDNIRLYNYPRDTRISAEIEWIKLEEGNKGTPYTLAPEDVQEHGNILTKHENEIEQNKLGLNTKVAYTEMNGTQRTLEKLLTEFSQTSTGFNFRIDSNGMIQDLTFDRSRFKLNSNLIEFNDGDVVIKDGKTSITQAFIEDLKAIDIDFNKATGKGTGVNSYLTITGDRIEQVGTYTRNWKQETETETVRSILEKGMLRFRNDNKDRSLYFSDNGVSTYDDAYGNGYASGGLIFFDNRYSGYRSVVLESTHGVVALNSERNRAIVDAGTTAHIESQDFSTYIRPYKRSRPGINEFRFWVKDGVDASATDGVLSYGNADAGAASGIRFQKSTSGQPTVWITNGNGDIGTGDISVMNAEVRGQIRSLGHLNIKQWNNTRAFAQIGVGAVNTYNSVVLASHSGGNAYFGVGSNEFRVTDNNGYNGGDTGWRDIRFGRWNAMSHEKFKYEIKEWNTPILDLFKEIQLYSYKERDSKDTFSNLIRRSIVLRDNPNEDKFPVEWRTEDGFDGNEVMWWNTKAIQELAHENDELKSEIKELNNKIDKIMEMIA